MQIHAVEGEEFHFGPYRLAPSRRMLLVGETIVDLGSRAFDILALLVQRHGEVVTQREILAHVWQNLTVNETNLRAQLAQLRHVLSRDDDTAYITNVRGRGYVFVAPVERVPPAGPPTLAPGRGRLPGRLQRLFGRSRTLDMLFSQLQLSRFMTVVGPGGIGKTTLAVELAHRLGGEFGNEIVYVDLGLLDSPDLVLPAIATALGYTAHADNPLCGLAAFVADRHLLLVLDCCEHVVEVASTIAATLVRNVPRLHLLATSREPLRAEGETVHLLEPLDLPVERPGLTAAEAMAAPSVALFMQRAADSGYMAELDDGGAEAVARICRQLDGNPLAIELAGSRLITYGFAGLHDVLRDRSILSWPGHRHEPRHRTLEATLDWSFRLLSDVERRVLARLSNFVGSFTMQAAQYVASDSADDRWTVTRAVEDLADKSLIAIRLVDGVHRYRILDVTRMYAGIKLAENGAPRLEHASPGSRRSA